MADINKRFAFLIKKYRIKIADLPEPQALRGLKDETVIRKIRAIGKAKQKENRDANNIKRAKRNNKTLH